jgi:hypothetical protein
MEGRLDVDAEGQREMARRQLLEGLVGTGGGVVDEDVDRSELGAALLDEGDPRLRLRDVALDRDRSPAGRDDPFDRLAQGARLLALRLVEAARDAGDARPGRGQSLGDSGADAPARPGHERNPARALLDRVPRLRGHRALLLLLFRSWLRSLRGSAARSASRLTLLARLG